MDILYSISNTYLCKSNSGHENIRPSISGEIKGVFNFFNVTYTLYTAIPSGMRCNGYSRDSVFLPFIEINAFYNNICTHFQ